MIRGGFARKDDSMALKLTNENVLRTCDTEYINTFIARQQKQFLVHLIRREDESIIKQLTFNDDSNRIPAQRCPQTRSSNGREFYKNAMKRKI